MDRRPPTSSDTPIRREDVVQSGRQDGLDDQDAGEAERLERRLSDLRAATTALEGEIEERRLRTRLEADVARKSLDLELAGRREEAERSIAALEADAARMREQHRRVLDGMRQQIEATAEAGLQQWRRDFQAAQQGLSALRIEAESSLHRALMEEQRRAAGEETRIRDAQKAIVEARVEAEFRRAEQEAEIIRLRGQEAALRTRLDAWERQWDSLGAGQPAEVQARWEEQKRTTESLRNELASRATVQQTRQLHEVLAERDQLRGLVAELQDEKQRLERSEMLQGAVRGDYAVLQKRCESLRAQIEVFEQLYESQNAAFTRLAGQVAATIETKPPPPSPDEIRTQRMGNLLDLRFEPVAPYGRDIEERAWLDQIHGRMLESGFNFPPRLLDSFHTCLKIAAWSPLTVLSGVSGTGKSELPRLYSRFGGLHHELVAVQTTWQSPQDIFGFYNFLENRFTAQPLLQALAQSQLPDKAGGLRSQLLLVVLDEMNLAKIEDYLSELLSRWELRRGDDDVPIEFSLGSDCQPFKLELGLNTLFVGTVNEDETTKMLSDKVLDRGNLLYFPRPRELRSRRDLWLAPAAKPLAYEQWLKWQRPTPDPETEADLHQHCETYRTLVGTMNDHLADAGRAVGHRVWQAIESYICNHPLVGPELNEPAGLKKAVRTAFEDQVVQRIVPRLRGLTLQGVEGNCLHAIADLIDAHDMTELGADFRAAVEASDRGFVWRQSEHLEPA